MFPILNKTTTVTKSFLLEVSLISVTKTNVYLDKLPIAIYYQKELLLYLS